MSVVCSCFLSVNTQLQNCFLSMLSKIITRSFITSNKDKLNLVSSNLASEWSDPPFYRRIAIGILFKFHKLSLEDPAIALIHYYSEGWRISGLFRTKYQVFSRFQTSVASRMPSSQRTSPEYST